MRRDTAIATALVLAAATPAVRAESRALGEGVAAYERADFQVAALRFAQVLRDQAATRGELAEAHRYLMTIHAATDDLPAAEAHAAILLALSPDATAIASAPPAARDVLARQRARRAGARMRLVVAAPGGLTAGVRARVEAAAAAAPAALSGRVTLRCTAASAGGAAAQPFATAQGRTESPPRRVTLAVPPLAAGTQVECVADLASEAGVVIAREVFRARAVAPAGATTAQPAGMPGWARGVLGASVALAVAGAAAGALAYGLAAASAQDAAAWIGPPRFAP